MCSAVASFACLICCHMGAHRPRDITLNVLLELGGTWAVLRAVTSVYSSVLSYPFWPPPRIPLCYPHLRREIVSVHGGMVAAGGAFLHALSFFFFSISSLNLLRRLDLSRLGAKRTAAASSVTKFCGLFLHHSCWPPSLHPCSGSAAPSALMVIRAL